MLGTLAAKWFPRELHEVMERSDQEVIETGRPISLRDLLITPVK